jgi:uncharacterized protein
MRFTLAALAAGFLLLLYMTLQASSDPAVHRFRYTPAAWPAGVSSVRLVLLTDTHVSGPDMPPARLRRIVETINRLNPDMVLLGGDFVSSKKLATKRYSAAEAIAPFAALHAPFGVYAVIGNHDHWDDVGAIRRELKRNGVVVLDNTAVRQGPITIGGVDDDFTGHADVRRVAEAMHRLGGIPILLSHSPDIFPATPGSIGLVLAGHTHCGQVSLPFVGPLFTASRFGRQYYCGIARSGNQTLIVSGGVGTSLLPIRLGAPPDLWVVDVGPAVRGG